MKDATARLHRINALLERAWSRGWSPRPELDGDALVAAARAQTGLDDFGAPGWRDRLDLLVADLAEAGLSPLGRTIAYGQLVAALANRLRAQGLWRRHPAIADQPIRAPIIVLGQMRSGTTRVQRLLACDPGHRFTRFFESFNPVPRWRLPGVDDRVWRSRIGLGAVRLLNPQFNVLHPTAVHAPDEETGLHSPSLYGAAFETQWRLPRFAAHGETIDTRPVYAEFRRLLQTLAFLRGDRTDRPLVLKAPQLTQDLAAVLATFPDARLVRLRRDPAALVASAASLVSSQMQVAVDSVDRAAVGREWLRKVALREARTTRTLATSDAPRTVIDFDAMNADWFGEMERVYAMLGRPLTAAVRARMAAFVARSARLGLAQHRYALADFGLTRAMVDEALADALAPRRAAA